MTQYRYFWHKVSILLCAFSSHSNPVRPAAAVSPGANTTQVERSSVLASIRLQDSKDRHTRTHLFTRHGVAHQCQVHELPKAGQGVQIGKLRDPVLGEDKRLQVRYARREIWLEVRYAILGEEQCAKAGLQRKVTKLRDVVVGEVDCVVVLLRL